MATTKKPNEQDLRNMTVRDLRSLARDVLGADSWIALARKEELVTSILAGKLPDKVYGPRRSGKKGVSARQLLSAVQQIASNIGEEDEAYLLDDKLESMKEEIESDLEKRLEKISSQRTSVEQAEKHGYNLGIKEVAAFFEGMKDAKFTGAQVARAVKKLTRR